MKQCLVCLYAVYVYLVCSLKVLMCACSIIQAKHSFNADTRLFYTPQSNSASNNTIWSQSSTQLFHCHVEIGTFNTIFNIVIIPLIHFIEPASSFHPISNSSDEILHKP